MCDTEQYLTVLYGRHESRRLYDTYGTTPGTGTGTGGHFLEVLSIFRKKFVRANRDEEEVDTSLSSLTDGLIDHRRSVCLDPADRK